MKVLVLGGTGVTGRLVCALLAERGCQVDVASRHAPNPPDPHHVTIDIMAGGEQNRAALSAYDWVVCCLGPFEKVQDRAAQACIAAGVNYIDVNDSIDARRKIMALDHAAQQAHVAVLTGMGLCPGISTAMIRRIQGDRLREVNAMLHIGSGQPAGAASVESMFETIHQSARILEDGAVAFRKHSAEPTDWVYYECPDIDLVTQLHPSVQDYTYRVKFEALDPKMIHKLQHWRLFTLPFFSRRLAALAAKGTTRRAQEAADPQPAKLTITATGPAGKGSVSIAGLTSYAFTATAVVGAVMAAGRSEIEAGVWDVVRRPDLGEAALAACVEAGATVEENGEA